MYEDVKFTCCAFIWRRAYEGWFVIINNNKTICKAP